MSWSRGFFPWLTSWSGSSSPYSWATDGILENQVQGLARQSAGHTMVQTNPIHQPFRWVMPYETTQQLDHMGNVEEYFCSKCLKTQNCVTVCSAPFISVTRIANHKTVQAVPNLLLFPVGSHISKVPQPAEDPHPT